MIEVLENKKKNQTGQIIQEFNLKVVFKNFWCLLAICMSVRVLFFYVANVDPSSRIDEAFNDQTNVAFPKADPREEHSDPT